VVAVGVAVVVAVAVVVGVILTSIPKNKPIRLRGRAKTRFRYEVAIRANMTCEVCKRHAPLLINGKFNQWCGQVAHIKGYGAGGGDTMDNVKWKCCYCHLEAEHGPQWSTKNED